MQRDLGALPAREYDVAIVGGGIFGICAAWEAVSRGLSVALIERGDFAGACSAASFRMVHGGIRYIQHGDIARIRESVRERRAWLRVAPHLVHPLPIVIPTFGHAMQGKEILWAGMKLYELCAADRNRGIADQACRIPPGTLLSRAEVLALFPELGDSPLNGAVTFCDGQMHDPPRLALAFLRSAVQAGAVAGNYVAASRFVREGARITGVECADVLTGETLRIRARMVVNTAGAWSQRLLGRAAGLRLRPESAFSRDTCLVLKRPARGIHALALLGQTRDPDALLSRAARHLFLVPWRDRTLLGVWHKIVPDDPDALDVYEDEVATFLGEVNAGCPALRLTPDDVSCFNAGLVLFGENRLGAADLRYGHRSRLVDHAVTDGVDGLITSIGVRWTTARGVADAVVTLAARKLRRRVPPSRTAETPVFGGDIADVAAFVERTVRLRPAGVTEDLARRLARLHGTGVDALFDRVRSEPALAATVADAPVLEAEVVHAVREEMAQRLGDVIYRRTELGAGLRPSRPALEGCARLMAAELGWTPARTVEEIELAERAFPVPRARPAGGPPARQPDAAA
jgi:glycerol-3-phosphate dehydrogenase